MSQLNVCVRIRSKINYYCLSAFVCNNCRKEGSGVYTKRINSKLAYFQTGPKYCVKHLYAHYCPLLFNVLLKKVDKQLVKTSTFVYRFHFVLHVRLLTRSSFWFCRSMCRHLLSGVCTQVLNCLFKLIVSVVFIQTDF